MADKIKLDIISDVVCPWCAIGYKRLEKAISELGIEDKVDIEWQPFQLNPHMPKEGQNVQEHITEKYGSSLEQQKLSQERMTDFGGELGFKFDYFDGMKMVNTRDAHILLDYAKAVGLNADEAMARLDSDDVRYQVQTKEKYWQSLGVTSVPTMVFNNKSALTGAQPVEVFKEVLTELLEK